MKKITLASLLMVSTLYFAKTEEPKKNTDLPKKEEKVLVAKKNFKDEKTENKIELKVLRTPFQQCVLDNSISIFAAYYVMGIPVDGDFIQAAATVQCMSDFDMLP